MYIRARGLASSLAAGHNAMFWKEGCEGMLGGTDNRGKGNSGESCGDRIGECSANQAEARMVEISLMS